MHLRGIVQTAALEERAAGSDEVDLVLKVQGVGPGQPRKIVVPFELLLQDEGLEPEAVEGHGFEAEVEEESPKRWVVRVVSFANRRVLRAE